ncbi:MAG: FecR domain-containing protein [Verrucomicrobiales bacterium]|nr:FecR domain-containing protein [Verrucomicrobiales bacterium]
MTLRFPSPEFDDTVAAVCHGEASDQAMGALNALLLSDAKARDEYLLRVELHARLASDPDLFAATTASDAEPESAAPRRVMFRNLGVPWWRSRPVLVGAFSLLLAVLGAWGVWHRRSSTSLGAANSAVAMLTRVVDARWSADTGPLRVGSALSPRHLRLESGMAQVTFYSGARVVLEGPAEVELISRNEVRCSEGRILAEVPPPAQGFRVRTQWFEVLDLGTEFGIDASRGGAEVHVFRGAVELRPRSVAKQTLAEGEAAAARGSSAPSRMAADATAFRPMFEFQQRSRAAEAVRYDQWRLANARLNQDPSLLLHLDFEDVDDADWTLRNAAAGNHGVADATIVGCRRSEGRWREKPALEFQSVSDRIRFSVPGEFESLTMAAWVCIKGLDRRLNALLMSDGFEPGTIHWLIRNDGVLGVTVFGAGIGRFQIIASPPVITSEAFGMWWHLAVVIDGVRAEAIHYVNGEPVSRQALHHGPPFRVGSAELGNWNVPMDSVPDQDLARNLSASIDEFELFGRAFGDGEVRELYVKGQPEP